MISYNTMPEKKCFVTG